MQSSEIFSNFPKLFFNFFFSLFRPPSFPPERAAKVSRTFLFATIFFNLFFRRAFSSLSAAGPLSEPGCKGKELFGNRKLSRGFFSEFFSGQTALKSSQAAFQPPPCSLSFPVPAEPGCKGKKGFPTCKGSLESFPPGRRKWLILNPKIFKFPAPPAEGAYPNGAGAES